MSFAVSTINDIGSPQHRVAVVAVDDVGVTLTLTTGYKTMEIWNSSLTITVYYGATGVTSSLGIPVVPEALKTFHGCQNGFKVRFICAAGETANLRVCEYP